jgi:hypothetical protein
MNFKHPKLGCPDRSWAYHDAESRLVGYVCRWDFADAEGTLQKEVLPICFCDLGNGKLGWRSKGMPSPRPLLSLPEILERSDAPILVTEGEKTRDAAAILFPDAVATTPAHGSKSPHLTDFSPCAGRTVIIATDHDKPGADFGDQVYELAREAGAASIMHLQPVHIGSWVWEGGNRIMRHEPVPAGWDLADALSEGWTAERIAELRDDPNFLIPYVKAETRSEVQDAQAAEGWPFRLTITGVEKRIRRDDKETGTRTDEWKWFCSILVVAAETRSSEGEEWGRLLEITDRDGRVKTWAMPMSMLAGDGTAYRERLLSLGLIMAPGKFARDALHEYITTARPAEKARCVGRIGWQGRVFVGFNRNYGERSHG